MKFKAGKKRRVTDKERISCGFKPEGIIPEVVKSSPAKKKFECKRGKGNHQYVLTPEQRCCSWMKTRYIEFECKFCGHKEHVRRWHPKTVYGKYVSTKDDIEKCLICGKEMIPDLEDKLKNGIWTGHTYKYNCDCYRKDLRLAVG